MPRTQPTRAIVPIIEHRCLYCRLPLVPVDGQPVFLCDKCEKRWVDHRITAIALFTRAQRHPKQHPADLFSKHEMALLWMYEHFRAKLLTNFYPYIDQLRSQLEWEDRQAQRKPDGRPRIQAHEWARQKVHVEGRKRREIFEEWKQKYQAETAPPIDIDFSDVFKKAIKKKPIGGKKVGT